MSNKPPEQSDIIRYEVGKFHLVFPDGMVEVNPLNIQEINIDNEYATNFLPLIRLTVSIDTKVYFRMVENRDKLKINMHLMYYKYNPTGKPDLKRTLFNKRFITLLGTNETNLMSKTFEESEKNVEANEEKEFSGAMNKKYVMELYLYSETDLNAIYSVKNMICNTNMSTLLVSLLSSAGVKDLLMAPLDNKSAYNGIIVPPITLGSTFRYLESQYGFYTSGAILYLGLINSFLLPKRAGKHAWVKNEINKTVFLIRESDDVNHLHDGSKMVFDEASAYLNVKPQNVILKSPMTAGYILGNDIKSIGPSRNTLRQFSQKNPQVSKKLPKYLYNKYDNHYQARMYSSELDGSSTMMAMTLSGINIRTIEPNKELVCQFFDKHSQKTHGGRYRIESSHIMMRNNGEHMIADAVVLLKR